MIAVAPVPTSGDALRALAVGDTARAEEIARAVLRRLPHDPTAHQVLGVAAYRRDDHAAACDAFAQAVAAAPDDPDARFNHAEALKRLHRYEEALPAFEAAVRLAPRNVVARVNHAHVLLELRRLSEAIVVARAALEIDPDSFHALHNLSLALWALGSVDEAVAAARRAVEIEPRNVPTWSNLLMYLQYTAEPEEDELLAAARAWGATMDRPPVVGGAEAFPEPARLRIGYVSGDLSDHPVGRQIERVLRDHDRGRVEVFLYATDDAEDAMTHRLRDAADGWRSLVDLDDEAAARRVAEDGIHVLVDLSGHTARHRLGVFAHRPAPVQASWLGYFATTGLPQMDYVLRDRAQIPDDEASAYTERVWPIDDAAFGYAPAEGCPEVAPLPALARGGVTFGCFANPAKISDRAIAAWARVLHAVPGSRMVLDRKGLDEPLGRDRVLEAFARHGVDPERLEIGASHGHLAYLARYAEVDLVLDTFPFNGATTTYEALWAGVPVVSRRWRRMVGHFAESILAPLGHADWVADDDDAYVARAVALATNLDALAALRAGLRETLAASSLCRSGDCAQGLEKAFWGMWRDARGEAEASPQEIDALLRAGIVAHSAGRMDPAEAIFRRVVELAPEIADGHHDLAETLLGAGRPEEAIPCYRRALALAPHHAEAHLGLGLAAARLGHFEEAATHLGRTTELLPSEPLPWFEVVIPLARLGRFPEAFAAFERGAILDPTLVALRGASLFTELGDALALRGRHEEARACHAEAAKLASSL